MANKPQITKRRNIPKGASESLYLNLGDLGDSSFTIRLEKGAELECVVSYFGAGKVSANIEFELGEDSRVLVIGAILCQASAEVNLEICTHHLDLNSSADVQVNCVVTGDSAFNFGGLIKIEPKGQQTNSFLTNKILTTGEKAKAATIPSLEIEADDVKASHAAIVGPIDQEQIFYLMSRGVSKKEAEDAIAEGFLGGLVEKISDRRIREDLRELVFGK